MAEKNYKRLYFILSAIVFAIVAARAWLVPFNHDETATFYYYIQNGSFVPFLSEHTDTNNHFLNSFLSWICFHLFGDSPFSLRLPNLLALGVLIISTYHFSKKFQHIHARLILLAGFILSFHWLSFFMVCRGYGISMALFVLALNYIAAYIRDLRISQLFKAYLFLDLALFASFTIIFCVLIIVLLVSVYQLYKRTFFKRYNLFLVLMQAVLMSLCIKYLFLMKSINSLYAGAASGYWKVTFVSLINTITGIENFWLDIVFTVLATIILGVGTRIVFKNIRKGESKINFMAFLLLLFIGLVLSYFLLNKIAHVNYPEDRTCLFFYPILIILLAYIIDYINPTITKPIAFAVTGIFCLHFIYFLNFNKHSLDMYDVVPQRFYDKLLAEQKRADFRITIGGNLFRELFYSFMNYRAGGELNHMDIPENPNTMAMNADYYIALKGDRHAYEPYYDEIDSEKYYGFTLLKRKHFLERKVFLTKKNQLYEVDGKKEFCNFLVMRDTAFKTNNPLGVELNFKVKSGGMPSHCWFVLTLDSAEGKTMYYRRVPMNWLRYSWLNQADDGDIVLETGPLIGKVHNFCAYLWNPTRQNINIQMNYVKLFQLDGPGADVSYTRPGRNGY